MTSRDTQRCCEDDSLAYCLKATSTARVGTR